MMIAANRAMGPLPPTASAMTRQLATGSRKGDALAAALEGRAFLRN
jgi:hypothetical protein